MSYGIKLGNRVISNSRNHQYILIPIRLEEANTTEAFDLTQENSITNLLSAAVSSIYCFVKPIPVGNMIYGAMIPNKLPETLIAHSHNERINIPYNHLQPGQSKLLTIPTKYKVYGIFNVNYKKLMARTFNTQPWSEFVNFNFLGGTYLALTPNGNSINISLKHESGFYNSKLTTELKGELSLTYLSYEKKKESYGFFDKGNYITENSFLFYADDLGTVTLKSNSKYTTKMSITCPNGWKHSSASNSCMQLEINSDRSKITAHVNPGVTHVRFFKVTKY